MRIRAMGILTAALAAIAGGTALVAAREYSRRPPEPREATIVVRLDLTPQAMAACAQAFVRYGFHDVREYECRLERPAEGLVVALYGPDYADPAYVRRGGKPPVRRLGAVPLSGGK